MITMIELGDILISYGFQVFALGQHGLPHANCTPCKLRGVESIHMAECSCLSCHGFYRATDDVEVLAEQLDARPWSILGVRTGLVSHLAVLDFDIHEGQANGLLVHDRWEAAGLLPPTPMVRTGGGGLHRYYRLTRPLKTNAGFRPGVDLKADGGYVVAPGCAKKGKPRYAQIQGSYFDAVPLAALPAWVLDSTAVSDRFIKPRSEEFARTGDPKGAFEKALAKLAGGKVGGRNTGVFACGCRAREAADRGLGDLAEMGAETMRVALQVGLTEAQFRKQWDSGSRPVARRIAPSAFTKQE